MLEDIPLEGPFVKDVIWDVSVDWVLKGLPSMYLTLLLFRDMCCEDKGSLPRSARQWQRPLASTTMI